MFFEFGNGLIDGEELILHAGPEPLHFSKLRSGVFDGTVVILCAHQPIQNVHLGAEKNAIKGENPCFWTVKVYNFNGLDLSEPDKIDDGREAPIKELWEGSQRKIKILPR